ncbi:hypothetical protein KCP73_00440 [Salmonella enterica subsp. enterica]|nr:hypothetical protein KCP73_00440 [Salmonella enterica subsp. enterica]
MLDMLQLPPDETYRYPVEPRATAHLPLRIKPRAPANHFSAAVLSGW